MDKRIGEIETATQLDPDFDFHTWLDAEVRTRRADLCSGTSDAARCLRLELDHAERVMSRLVAGQLNDAEEAVEDLRRRRPDISKTQADAAYVVPVRTAQAAWLSYRMAHCKIAEAIAFPGGSGGALFELTCRLRVTRERIGEIRIVGKDS